MPAYSHLFLAALLALCAASPGLHAQPQKIQRIGVLMTTSEAAGGHLLQAFQQGMRDLGYIDGKNIRYEIRYAEGNFEKLDQDARDFVRSEVALIYAPVTRAADAARRASSSTPVVFTIQDLAAKRMELLHELLPSAKRIGYVHDPSGSIVSRSIPIAEEAARVLGKELLVVEMPAADALSDALSKLKERRAEALLGTETPLFSLSRKKFLQLLASNRLPSIHGDKQWVLDGALISYGIDYADAFRRSAAYVDRILKGAKPAELPVQQPTKFELVVNLKTAKALGITVPRSILLRADQVVQ